MLPIRARTFIIAKWPCKYAPDNLATETHFEIVIPVASKWPRVAHDFFKDKLLYFVKCILCL